MKIALKSDLLRLQDKVSSFSEKLKKKDFLETTLA